MVASFPPNTPQAPRSVYRPAHRRQIVQGIGVPDLAAVAATSGTTAGSPNAQIRDPAGNLEVSGNETTRQADALSGSAAVNGMPVTIASAGPDRPPL
jgi:hypothetical protein